MPFQVGEIISYPQMCAAEEMTMQPGMTFRSPLGRPILLTSLREGAPYNDPLEEDGRVLIYEGHDARVARGENPKKIDQPSHSLRGKPTQNQLFFEAAQRAKQGASPAERVRVYEKIRSGTWVFDGTFDLIDSWTERVDGRLAFRFRLVLRDQLTKTPESGRPLIRHTRLIPSSIKREVYKRDEGRCVVCGSDDNLHFDHVVPFAKGGTSLSAVNIQILCMRHNLEKSDKIV